MYFYDIINTEIIYLYEKHILIKEALFMAEQALVQARVDKELKQEVAEIYEALGMDLPTAIRMFFVRSKMVRGLPFDTTLPKNVLTRTEAMNALEDMFSQAADAPELSLDEINAEIAEVRANRRAAKG
jgi:DNA-damage-inducible protein J